MPYIVVGLLILAAVAWVAVNLAYFVFAAAMSVVNAASAEPVVFLHGRIMREAEAGMTIRYKVVRQPSRSAYADSFSDNLIVFEAVNRSRWPVTSISPRCTLAIADGSWASLTVDTRVERTRLDDPGRVSTAVPPGGTLKASLRTDTARHDGPVVRADCAFNLSVPWWMWVSEMPPRAGGRP